MKVSGYTFIRNGVLLSYPFIESIKSALPLCDEFIVAVGNSDDNTLALLQAIDSDKIIILQTQWNESMQDRGFVYAQQKMIAQYNCTGDWAFYLEGDEVLHEADIDNIRNSMLMHLNNQKIEALVFDYKHFFGSPEWLAISPGWYRHAPRIIRNSIRTWAPDGLFFVVMDKNKHGRYPYAALINAPIYHYGHVRSVAAMREKNHRVGKYWGHDHPLFGGYQIDSQALAHFNGSHPKIMQNWLENQAETRFIQDIDYQPTRRELKHRWMMKLEKWLGLELSKKHYTLASIAPEDKN